MGQGLRRSAGTQTALDVLLRWAWIRRRSSAQDIEDFTGGQTIQVVAFTKSIGGEAMISVGKGKQIARMRSGYLHFTVGQPPVWHDRRDGASATLRPPFTLTPKGEKVPLAPKFTRFMLATAGRTHDIAIPKKDVEFVRYALS
jgi:hypothetical protein